MMISLTIMLMAGCLVQKADYLEIRERFLDQDSDGVTPFDGDCDDSNPAISPDLDEICDGLDNDCDGLADQDDDSLVLDGMYIDSDGDGFGAQEAEGCDDGDVAAVSGDCDDENPDVAPGRAEVCDNGVDDNCDGMAEECVWTGRHTNRAVADWSLSTDGYLSAPLLLTGLDSDGDQDLEIVVLLRDEDNTGAVRGFELAADSAGDVSEGAEMFELRLPSSNGIVSYLEDGLQGGESAFILSDGSGDISIYSAPLSGMIQTGDADIVLTVSGQQAAGLPVGDIDHDGLSDIAVFYRGKEGQSTYLMSIEGYYGDPVSDVAYARIVSDAAGGYSDSPNAVGDIDGDGIDDLVVGSPGYANLTGQISLFTGPLSGDRSLADADVVVSGDNPQDLFGLSVSSLGDVDGDGRVDIAVSSPFFSTGESAAGAVYIIGDSFGEQDMHTIARLDGLTRQDIAGILPIGSRGGDFSGDGVNDLVVGAVSSTSNDPGGVIYVHYAPFGGVESIEAADAIFLGEEGDLAILGAINGDYNQDGVDDLIIGNAMDAIGQVSLLMIPGKSL